MSAGESLESIMSQARELEKSYDWTGSVELYRSALDKVLEQDVVKAAEIHERIGYGFFRVAAQADSVEEFKSCMRMSVEAYEKAAELFEVRPASGLYCRAMARYSDSWFVEEPSHRSRLLDECWKFMKEALERFDASGDLVGYGKAFRGLSFCLYDRYNMEGDWRECERIVEEAITYARKTIERLSQTEVENELAWAYTMLALFIFNALDQGLFEGRKEQLIAMNSNNLEKASELCEKIGDAYLHAFLDFVLGWNSVMVSNNMQAAWKYVENELKQAERLRDHFQIGMAYLGMHVIADTIADFEEDPDKRREKRKEVIRFAEESIRHSLLVYRYYEVAYAYTNYMIDNYTKLAEVETDIQEKKALLKHAIEVGRKGTEYAKLSGSPIQILSIFHFVSKAIYFLAEIETSITEKKKLLEEALKLREKSIQISEKALPHYSWSRGAIINYLALIKADLARMEENEEMKKNLFEEAVSIMEKCIDICKKSFLAGGMTLYPGWHRYYLAQYHDWFGEILNELYLLKKDEHICLRAIDVYQDAAQLYQKLELSSRVAEAYWKAARSYAAIGEHPKAAETFSIASNNYKSAAEKIPQLKDFYGDHAVYMQAWSEIEKARHHHAKQEYGLAKDCYEKAATMHKPLKQWGYLASNYSAWTQIENAEDLSRKEQSIEAIQAFEQATKLFIETKKLLQSALSKIENTDEKTMVTNLLRATDLRRQYCIGRIALEEAKILDKKGDHYSSSEKYGLATQTFEQISLALESEQDRKEFKLIITLSRAWQKMTQAEVEVSPDLYMEASKLFEQAKELSPNERAKMLALGHSRFCRALEAGTKFADTRDATQHAIAIQHLEIAASYYVKAGFQNASEYAKATELLLDAYVHMDNAKKETDQEKKAKLYAMAEKVLQTSAGSFMKAEHPEKREQVLRLFEKVKEERELALSLSEVLHAPSIVSATTAFTTPTPTHENAVGLDRFEHADIQANVITRHKSLKVGEKLEIEIELVNAGKGPALLVKLTEVIPEGFELTEKPEIYRVEDSYLNMKGKRLDPLKTEEIRLVLKPKVQGVFPLKPKILYLDENGNYRAHEPEPITITVRELGISGWLKGP